MATTKAQREKAASKSRRYRAKLKAARAAPNFPVPARPKHPGQAIALWSKSTLLIPSGPMRGKPFELQDWQVEFLEDAFRPEIMEAGVSLPRKVGKTGLLSVAISAFMCGPCHFEQFRAVVTSLTGTNAKEARFAMQLLAEISNLPIRFFSSPTPGYATGPNGSRVDFLGADKSTGHSLAADIAVIDDAGLLPESRRDLWDAMLSSISGRNGKFLALSIQGTSPMFRELRERRGDPAVAWHQYSADADADIQDEEQWRKSHPDGVLGTVKSLDYMRSRSRGAAASGQDQNFRAFDLNIDVDPSKNPIVTLSQWLHCSVEDRDALPPREGDCYLGLDLGGAVSLSAVAAAWSNGRFEVWACCPNRPDLKARGKADGEGNRYVKAHERGELFLMGDRVSDPVQLMRHVATELEGVKVAAVAADQFRKSEVQDGLDAAGVRWPVKFRRVGNGRTAVKTLNPSGVRLSRASCGCLQTSSWK